MIPEIWSTTDRIFSRFGPFGLSYGIFFTLLPPQQLEKWKYQQQKMKTKKKRLEISSFYTSVPKVIIIGYTVPEIWHVTDVTVIFHFGLFCPFDPPNTRKNENFKKWKNHLEISSFYTSVPKIIIMCYTVPEIWHVTHVIFIFHFRLFSVLLPP